MSVRVFIARAAAASLAACLAAGVLGCDAAAARRDLASAYPLDRARGAARTAALGDVESVHTLVNLLEDDDRAVRLVASLALRRLCGDDLGYRYYDPPAQRAAAVQRWRDALRNGLPARPPGGSAVSSAVSEGGDGR